MKRWICSLLLLLGTAGSAWSAGLIIVDEAHWRHQLPPDGIFPPPWPPPRPRPEPWPRPWPVPPPRIYQFCPLEVTRHQASVRITDQLAATSIEQEFYNPNDQRIEGTFLFPIPKGAQIKKFTIVRGDWLPGGDELTPTMKLKRKPIDEKYADEIEEMYAR